MPELSVSVFFCNFIYKNAGTVSNFDWAIFSAIFFAIWPVNLTVIDKPSGRSNLFKKMNHFFKIFY